MARQRPTRGAPKLVIGPCIVEIDRIVIRDVQYQFEVNQLKGNFWWAWSMWAGMPQFEIDRIVIRDVEYQFEVNQCSNEEVVVKGNFGWAWPMWGGGMPWEIDYIVIKVVQYQFEENLCRNEEVIVKGSFGWAWSMWAGSPQVKIDHIVIRDVQYQFEFQGSSAYRRTDRQTDSGDTTTISPRFSKIFENGSGQLNNMAASVHIEKCPAHWRPCFSPIWTNFKFVRYINKTNVLANFHDDWAKIVTSRVFTSHINQLTGTIFELNSHIKKTNVLTKFHENWAKNLECSHKNAPPTGGHVYHRSGPFSNLVFTRKTAPPGSHVIQLTGTIFKLNSHIKETNAKNVTSRVFTCFHYLHIEKNAPPTGGHVFSPIWTIFELVRDINKTNNLTNLHDDWAKLVTSKPNKDNCPAPGGHVFQRTGTTFELNQHIIKTNILTNDLFQTHRNFIGTKLLTKFHEDRSINQMLTDGRTYDGQRPVTKAHMSNQANLGTSPEVRYLYRRVLGETAIDSKNGPGTVFSTQEEKELAEFLSEMAKRGMGLRAVTEKRKTPITNKRPS
ncbi:hypothetical protein DPMN_028948 [Dreissena polymorpha]|uniref:Uncharacterized protein n=1 Tax=Dreissena polymorpha TaxID=45954 RepID=A0A9D4LZV5_DREPO|nr:hypothetical protein DPMN_028948 [Dreissena polymorpha]